MVNLADEGTANAMHLTGTEIPEAESEFAKFGLTPVPAKLVKHPRIAEAAASFECRVERRIEFGPEREMVVGEILLIHARDGIIDPVTKRISEELYRPVGRLFANRYCTTRQRFDLPGTLPPGEAPSSDRSRPRSQLPAQFRRTRPIAIATAACVGSTTGTPISSCSGLR